MRTNLGQIMQQVNEGKMSLAAKLLEVLIAELKDDKEWYVNCLKTCSECTTTQPICEDRLKTLNKILGE